ncbi:MAG TPA: sugar phosphate isomerase/epimerase family protein [Armatimonadota bacterium]|nr:sugar phosphate isomerase/epimerase family protein [Armatimonadota bacterium]
MLSISTDYRGSHGDAAPALHAIADAGFTHIHWCHEWNTDYRYSDDEIRQICVLLQTYGLRLSDLHASSGATANWGSLQEDTRRAGVALIVNRILMTATLGGDAIVIHLPDELSLQDKRAMVRDAIYHSIDELLPVLRTHGIRMALENALGWDNTGIITDILETYRSEFLGLCYDAGHGNIIGNGCAHLDALKSYLIVTHLHDNNGIDDQHRIPFTGTIDWTRLTELIAASPYSKPLTLEVTAHPEETDVEFLTAAFTAGSRLTDMVAAARRVTTA